MMTGLDMRLVMIGPFMTTPLEIDEIQMFKTCLELSVVFPQQFVPFFVDEFFNLFHNYGIVIYTLKENIERYMFNYYGFYNVIYLPIKQSSDEDPFSFYIFDKYDAKGNRCWRMDCRLDGLTKSFISDLRYYMIGLFRSLYHGVFHDNEYRREYMYTNTVTENDCEQLLQNIFALASQHKFSTFLRDLVRKYATYKPTDKDKFNLYGDDHFLKKSYQESKSRDNSDEMIEIVKMLFDNVTSEEAIRFYKRLGCM
jgi:hypothetical protein